MHIPRRLGCTLALFAVVGVGVSCATGEANDPDHATTPARPQAPATSVDSTTERVQLEVGQTLAIEFGTINYSIGDSWSIATDPDPAVLQELLQEVETPEDVSQQPPMPGADTTLTMRFVAVGTGQTTIEFQYSYRGRQQDTRDGSPGGRTMAIVVR